jgi:ABC-type amino acid transport substrate-binding protein/mono/diheme cytochrome c family protein
VLPAAAGIKGQAILKAFVPAFCLSLFAMSARAGEASPLRLCADPDNLPFSSDRPNNPGLYNEIGAAIARELNRPVTAVWYRTNFGKRAIRSTLLAKQCDLAIGLPADPDLMGPALIFSKSFMQAGYALVTKKSYNPALSIAGLSGRAIAVQFGTPPQSLLANHDGIRMVTRMTPEDGVRALATGEADAAFVWGPSAGYLNKTEYAGAFSIVPVDGAGFQWPVAIAFAKRDAALRDEADAALDRIGGEIEQLKAKYGFPTESPVKLSRNAAAASPIQLAAFTGEPIFARRREARAQQAQAAAATPVQKLAEDAAPKPAADSLALVAGGKEFFNGTCAHCHGPNAEQSERKIDLRLLRHRYGDGMEEMFFKTVTAGRPAKGMPSWKDVFTAEQFTAIFAFLKTVQTD